MTIFRTVGAARMVKYMLRPCLWAHLMRLTYMHVLIPQTKIPEAASSSTTFYVFKLSKNRTRDSISESPVDAMQKLTPPSVPESKVVPIHMTFIDFYGFASESGPRQ